MTEQEWLANVDPKAMLDAIRGKASDRKLRLFGCACARRIWELLEDPRSRAAVEVVERFADKLATDDERLIAREGANQAAIDAGEVISYPNAYGVTWAPQVVAQNDAHSAAETAELYAAKAYAHHIATCHEGEIDRNWLIAKFDDWRRVFIYVEKKAHKAQAEFLRDVVGNPFRPIAIPAHWRTPDIVALAQAAYDERPEEDSLLDSHRLVVLSDILEDAGCDSAEILNHLRSPGPHVRGCWVLDLLLGRE